MATAPKNTDKKRADEKLLVSEMIALYCKKQHGTPKGTLCPECQQLHDYALLRIDKCPFMETKTFCSACKVHCYQPAMREKIRAVMRWAGPRMLPVHPVLSVKHVAVTLKSKREAKKPADRRINPRPTGQPKGKEVISMENVGVTCDVCACCHNVGGCKCDLPQIRVTEQCTCTQQPEETPHYCQNYEEK